MKRLVISLALIVQFSIGSAAWSGESYFLYVFGSQTVPVRPRYNHTFATFVKVTADGSDLREGQIEVVTISWLPVTREMRPFRQHPEPGVNLTLEESLRVTLSQGQRVSQWGPFQTDADLYEAARCKAAQLERGELQYRALDPWRRRVDFTDCIHAIVDLDSRLKRHYRPEILLSGDRATARLVRDLIALERIQNPDVTHDWLNACLGLEHYPIRRVCP